MNLKQLASFSIILSYLFSLKFYSGRRLFSTGFSWEIFGCLNIWTFFFFYFSTVYWIYLFFNWFLENCEIFDFPNILRALRRLTFRDFLYQNFYVTLTWGCYKMKISIWCKCEGHVKEV